LNKLPELFNVVKGDLCLVGERPFSLTEAAKLTTDKSAAKLLATPGLTGLWGIRKGHHRF
jgi:lipopolysaccharide/colanic/teichoic acid biosynthesis glycosyltransferase